MNTHQQDIYDLSLAISKINFLKKNKKKVSLEAMNNIDTKQKEFQKLFKETKKIITDTNKERRYMEINSLKDEVGFKIENSGTFVILKNRNKN